MRFKHAKGKSIFMEDGIPDRPLTSSQIRFTSELPDSDQLDSGEFTMHVRMSLWTTSLKVSLPVALIMWQR